MPLGGPVTQVLGMQSPLIGRTITVPIDHHDPAMGIGSLYFEFGSPFDESKPVVFVIADAQQYYVRRGAVADIQKALFGDYFNVVGIIGRGSSPEFIKAARTSDGRPDWVRAWRIFKSEQWIDDIDAVRKAVVGDSGKILLYGRSGGALLVHQYLAKYGGHVLKAFTSASLNPFIIRDLGLNTDHFWEEIGTFDTTLQTALLKVLEERPSERATIITTLQRQNFFVPLEKLPEARAELIRSLANGDLRRFEVAKKEYQVDIVESSLDSPEGIPAHVRIFEFYFPLDGRRFRTEKAIYPDLENRYDVAKPLVTLCHEGKIVPPSFDFNTLHRLDTEVFILAGRFDHAEDYRSSIALAYNYPRHYLFIANDNHIFEKLNSSGDYEHILRAFLRFGLSSTQLHDALHAAEPNRWAE